MKWPKLFIALALTIFFLSCEKQKDLPLEKMDPSISGEVRGKRITYIQTIFNGGLNGNINVYNSMNKELYLRAFQNEGDETYGYWSINLIDVDLNSISIPYTLQNYEGRISWMDESVQRVQSPCTSPDVLCFYSGSTESNDLLITITEVSGNHINGTFSGVLNHVTINPTVVIDPNDFVSISSGTFSMEIQRN